MLNGDKLAIRNLLDDVVNEVVLRCTSHDVHADLCSNDYNDDSVCLAARMQKKVLIAFRVLGVCLTIGVEGFGRACVFWRIENLGHRQP